VPKEEADKTPPERELSEAGESSPSAQESPSRSSSSVIGGLSVAALAVLVAGLWGAMQYREVVAANAALKNSHKADLAGTRAEIDRLKSEQARINTQLKKAFDSNRALLKERDTLAKTLKEIQEGFASGGRPVLGGRLPDIFPGGSVEPVTVRPLIPGASDEAPTLRDGGRLLVQRSDGFYVLDRLPSSYQAALGPRGIRVSGLPSLLAKLPAPPAGLFELVSPVGEVVEATRPRFSWKSAGPGAKHQVIVLNEAGVEIAKSPWIEGDSWTSDVSLPRGKIARWKMMVLLGEGQEAKPRAEGDGAAFAVTGEEETQKLEKVRKEASNSHLLLALASAEAGLIAEAERHLATLQKANPKSPIPAGIRSQIVKAAKPAP
jgi:hypothetical protein